MDIVVVVVVVCVVEVVMVLLDFVLVVVDFVVVLCVCDGGDKVGGGNGCEDYFMYDCFFVFDVV